MENLHSVLQQLREERARLKGQIETLDRAISVLSSSTGVKFRPNIESGRRTMSTEGRRRIAEAQRRRWAKVKASKAKTGKRILSAAARRRIVAAQKARWSRFRAAKKD